MTVQYGNFGRIFLLRPSIICGRFVISRARNELGFPPQVNLAEGVREGIAWYKGACSALSRSLNLCQEYGDPGYFLQRIC